MGYATYTRRHPNAPYGHTSVPVGPPWVTTCIDPAGTYLSGLQSSTQETYSYRTGSQAEQVIDADEEALFNVDSSGEFFSVLKDEYERAPQSDYDTGHEFKTTQKLVVCTPTLDEYWRNFGFNYRYQGPVVADPGYTSGTFYSMAGSNPNYYGPLAISNCQPLNPVVDLAVTLAELKREGIPKLGAALMNFVQKGKEIKSIFGELSEEYLAWEFGAKPMLADYLNACQAAATANGVLATAIENSGKLLHRTYSFPLEREYELLSAGQPGLLATISPDSDSWGLFKGARTGFQTREWVRQRRIWFSGGFTYYYPAADGLIGTLDRFEFLSNQLVDLRVDADVLWNLTPWSWLADWVSNFGINISNAEAFSQDGLVMKYGYLMTETISDHVITIYGPQTQSGVKGPFTTIYRTIVKERVKSSPFGFALNPGSFSPRQWAILAALGFTKAPGQLKGE